ncbi:hypothetical protein [Aquimarina rhabdastrellae]
MKTSKKYTRELFRQFKYFAAWLPGTPLSLGDIGIMKGKQFIRIGNLKDEKYQLDFEIKKDTTPSDIKYSSEGSVSVTSKISGTVPPTNSTLTELDAGFNVAFSKKNAIHFKAKNTYNHTIKDQIKLGGQILNLYKLGKWDKDYVIITELVEAESSTILISCEKNSNIDLTANADIGSRSLDIADAELGLGVKFSRGIATELICEKGLTPLFRVSKIKSRLFSTPDFEVMKVRGYDMMESQYAVLDNDFNYFGEVDEFDFEEDYELA